MKHRIAMVRKGIPFVLYRMLFPAILLFIFTFSLKAQTYNIDDYNGQTVNICAGTFYDSNNGAGDYYDNNETYIVTFCSDNSDHINFDFTTFEIRTGDTLWIYDGPDTSAPLLGAYTGEGRSFSIASSGTCLTFRFVSDPQYTREGWVASISCGTCFPPVTSPITPGDANVCAGETITYSINNHTGSTYDWTVVNGAPASYSGSNTLDITWSSIGGISGYVKVVETGSCGAKDSSELVVDINNAPLVSFSGLLSDYCIYDENDTLTGIPAGGVFSGDGITDSIFSPAIAGPGPHTIIYSYTDPTSGCTGQDSQTTTVHDTPAVNLTGLDTLYDINDPAVTLSGNPAGGVFSGPGVTGDTFYPDSAGVGIHQIIYQYTDASGCTNADTAYTEVRNYDFKAGAIILSDIDNWCSSDARYSTIGATPDESRGSCWPNGPGFNRWFKFRATTTQVFVQVKIGGDEGTMRYPLAAIWDESGSQIACTRYASQYSDISLGSAGLTPGEWYYISVDNYNNAGYRGTFTLCVDDSVNNDFKAGAIELTDFNNWCSGNAAYTTMNASPDESRGSCWNTGPNFNVWFKFQATSSDINITLKTGGDEGTLRYPYIALWDDSSNEIACARYAGSYSDLSIGSTSLVPGNWYYISVDNYNNVTYRGTFTLCIDNTITYDFREGALEIPDTGVWCSGDAAYSTMNASADGIKGSCWNTGPNYNRWFKFQATTPQVLVQLKTGGDEGTLRYPYLVLQDSTGNELGCARYSSTYSDLSVGATGLTVGDWYYISVDNYANNAYRGTFTLCVTDSIDYDFKAGAIELTDINNWTSSEAAYTTMNASPDESKGSCWPNGPGFNRWFKFQATNNMITVKVKTGGSEGTLRYPYVAIWDDSNAEVACTRYTSAYSDLSVGSNNLIP
ncbi:MAG: CUB domain-containing protein, partial [Bacteroidales bacterium]|nr:CUB domain-containing protein [Bacteroidales bacterium]